MDRAAEAPAGRRDAGLRTDTQYGATILNAVRVPRLLLAPVSSPPGTTRAVTSMMDPLSNFGHASAGRPAASARRMVSVTPRIGPAVVSSPADLNAR
jgi:hypothetical protein